MNNLISMTDFVLEQYKNNYHANTPTRILKYANFLKQPLKIEMFVPCDEQGNVLEKPKFHYTKNALKFLNTGVELDIALETNKKVELYEEAKERCLFNGFEFTESQNYSTVNKIKNSVHWYTKDRLYLTTKKEEGYHSYFQLFIVEDLVKCDLQLTKNGLKCFL